MIDVAAAQGAVAHALLNCHLREGGAWRLEAGRDGPVASIDVPAAGGRIVVRMRHVSPSGHHRFELPGRLEGGDGSSRPVGVALLACLLVEALGAGDPRGAGAPTALLERVLDGLHVTRDSLRARGDDIARLWGAEPLSFIDSEQALLLGHPLHPTAKSRGEMGDADRRRYSPELRARFPLRWLAVSPECVAHDSAVEHPAPYLAERLLRDDPAVSGDALDRALAPLGPRVLVPAHPWQFEHLRDDPRVAALVAAGAIVDLGEWGAPMTPTSSLRTLYREDARWQVKFSLSVRVTNSLRITLPKELVRAVEAARLAQTDVGSRAAAAAPALVILHDPAYLAVCDAAGIIDGLSVLLRHNRWPAGADRDATAVTALCQEHPHGGHSRLVAIVGAIARRDTRGEHEVAREWFARYCAALVVPLLRLYLDVGLCFEPHQQNTLLELEDGWPVRGVVRDSQGYFHRELAHEDMVAVIPRVGEASESIFPEALADERLVYYPFVNNALGVIGALGAGGCADEAALLAHLADVVRAERARAGRYPPTLLDRVLDDATWPCKANLRTRLHDLDELVGDIATQSVYVTIPNPLPRPHP